MLNDKYLAERDITGYGMQKNVLTIVATAIDGILILCLVNENFYLCAKNLRVQSYPIPQTLS